MKTEGGILQGEVACCIQFKIKFLFQLVSIQHRTLVSIDRFSWFNLGLIRED